MMAILVGGPKADILVGTDPDDNTIFGDPYVDVDDIFASDPLTSGRGGNDAIWGADGAFNAPLAGDAVYIAGHAVGGNDRIYGGANGAFNILNGDAAISMSESSRGGNDKLYGGDGSFNQLVGDANNELSGNARGGNDELYGGANALEQNALLGDAISLLDNARGGNDVIHGGMNSFNRILGDAEEMKNQSRGGNDLLVGGNGGPNFIVGDAGSMYQATRGGNDVLHGGNGDDELYGDAQDVLSFDFEPATDVRGGNDVLVGGAGDDRMWGDFGAIEGNFAAIVTRGTDRFVFANGSGHDAIFDFENDKDVIDLRGYAGITGFGQVGAHASQVGADVAIDLGAAAGHAAGADVLTLADFSLGNLNNADFLFA